MKFNDLSPKEKINALREQFVSLMVKGFSDPDTFKNSFSPEELSKVNEYLKKVKPDWCECSTCVDTSFFDLRVAPELSPVIELAKKMCLERAYP